MFVESINHQEINAAFHKSGKSKMFLLWTTKMGWRSDLEVNVLY